MTKRNFKAGADRGNKLLEPRGLPGQTFGAAGPVKRIDPTSTPDPEATTRKIHLAYAKYAARTRRDGCMPLPPVLWLKRIRELSHPGKTPGSVHKKRRPRDTGPGSAKTTR